MCTKRGVAGDVCAPSVVWLVMCVALHLEQVGEGSGCSDDCAAPGLLGRMYSAKCCGCTIFLLCAHVWRCGACLLEGAMPV